jgi:hypothetical protein
MPACSFALRTIFNGEPSHVTKITNLRPDDRENHQYPFIDGVDKYNPLPFGLLFDGLANPCGRAFLLALMDDGSKRRVDIVGLAPFACEAVESLWQWTGTRVKIKVKFRVKFGIEGWGSQPIMFAVLPVALMELIVLGHELRLMDGRQVSSPSASDFSVLSSSVLAGRPAPHPLSCPILARVEHQLHLPLFNLALHIVNLSHFGNYMLDSLNAK